MTNFRTSPRTGLGPFTLGLPVLLALVFATTTAEFRSAANLLNFGGQTAALLMATLGQMFVTITGGIDLSVGAVISVASCLVATHPYPAAGVPMALAFAIGIGLVNGWGVAVAGLHPLVMTLCTATIAQGLALVILPIPGGEIAPLLRSMAGGEVAGLPAPMAWFAVAVLAAAGVLRGTRLGLHLFAVGSQARSAHLNGVPVRAVVVAAYVGCSLAAACAGIFLCGRVAAGDPGLGAAFALESVAAVALGGVQLTGGVGSALGVACGVLSLGMLSNGLNLFGVSPFLRGAVTGVLLLAAVGFQRRRQAGL